MKPHYFNEFDAGAAAWLRELIKAGHLPAGDVDERSITEVQADDLRGYGSAHFFGGVGGWPFALRLAGWPDDRSCWTGSCPCQPYSAAGKRLGDADARNLWPHFFRLIRECRPEVVFGEQVASAEVVGSELEAAFVVAVQAGRFDRANKLAKRLAASRSLHFHRRWLDGIQADLEGAGYAFGNSVLGAHSVQAPHVRQRLFWVAHAGPVKRLGRPGVERPAGAEAAERREEGADHQRGGATGELEHAPRDGREQGRPEPGGRGAAGGRGPGLVGDASGAGLEVGGRERGDDGAKRSAAERAGGGPCGVGHADREPRPERDKQQATGLAAPFGADASRSGLGYGAPGFWDAFDLIPCRDGRLRRVPAGCLEPGVQRVADGLPGGVGGAGPAGVDLHPLCAAKVPGRVGLLRGFGNAIVPQVAAEFVKAFLEVTEG